MEVDTALRDEWLGAVDALAAQVAQWVRQEAEWSFEEENTEEIEEPLIGQYVITIWSIQTPEGEVRLEPMRRDFLDRQFVELYAWPTLRRVHLLHNPAAQEWRILTDSGIYLRQEWNRENFVLLVRDLIAAD